MGIPISLDPAKGNQNPYSKLGLGLKKDPGKDQSMSFSLLSPEDSAKLSYLPPKPSDVIAMPLDGKINLSWKKPDGSKGVVLLRTVNGETPQLENGKEYKYGDLIGDAGVVIYVGEGDSFEDTELSNGKDYSYAAYAYDDAKTYSSGAATNATPSADGISVQPMSDDIIYVRLANQLSRLAGRDVRPDRLRKILERNMKRNDKEGIKQITLDDSGGPFGTSLRQDFEELLGVEISKAGFEAYFGKGVISLSELALNIDTAIEYHNVPGRTSFAENISRLTFVIISPTKASNLLYESCINGPAKRKDFLKLLQDMRKAEENNVQGQLPSKLSYRYLQIQLIISGSKNGTEITADKIEEYLQDGHKITPEEEKKIREFLANFFLVYGSRFEQALVSDGMLGEYKGLDLNNENVLKGYIGMFLNYTKELKYMEGSASPKEDVSAARKRLRELSTQSLQEKGNKTTTEKAALAVTKIPLIKNIIDHVQ